MTPIIYPMSIAEGHRFFWVIHWSPIRSVLEVFRDPIYFGKIPPMSHLSLSVGLAFGLLIIGALVFRRFSHRIPFYL